MTEAATTSPPAPFAKHVESDEWGNFVSADIDHTPSLSPPLSAAPTVAVAPVPALSPSVPTVPVSSVEASQLSARHSLSSSADVHSDYHAAAAGCAAHLSAQAAPPDVAEPARITQPVQIATPGDPVLAHHAEEADSDVQIAGQLIHKEQPAATAGAPTSSPSNATPLQGFDTMDAVQRYALASLTVLLFNRQARDLNGYAFARTQSALLFEALGLGEGQQNALLALDPAAPVRDDVLEQCAELVGDFEQRFHALQAVLALSVVSGTYDARSRVFLAAVADLFYIPWPTVAAIELAIAAHLVQQAELAAETQSVSLEDGETPVDHSTEQTGSDPLPNVPGGTIGTLRRAHHALPPSESDGTLSNPAQPPSVGQLLIKRRKKKMRVKKAMKIGGITLVGGVLFGLTGGLIAPGLLAALAGVGVAGASGLAASGTLASGAVVGGLFGVAGSGLTLRKARNRVRTTIDEFDFERPDDPRVVEERKRKVEREKRKLEKLVAQRLAEEAAANARLAIDAPESDRSDLRNSELDPERELPRPPPPEDADDDDDDEHDSDSERSKRGSSSSGKRRKKRKKLKVGARGLEAAAAIPSLHICICVPAWLTGLGFGSALDQFEPALKQELPCSQHIALRWESRRLYDMGLAFAKFWASKATVTTVQQAYPHAVAAASSVAGAVAFAFAIPLTVVSCMDYIDNPWSILVSRSNGAGEELADVLVERSYGNRPVTLFGYSLGARVLFKCLESLASRGAWGIVDNVFVMGAAITADPERWKKIRQVVTGRIVNAYGSYDWALAFFHRGCGNGVYVSGLRRVELDGVENLNMGYLGIEGHRELKDCVPRVMRAMGIGIGYITMPPARLVQRKQRKSESVQQPDSLECEEPGRAESPNGRSDDFPSDSTGISNDAAADQSAHTIWDSDEPVDLDSSHPNGGLDSSEASREAEKQGNSKGVGEQRRSKSKSWLSWSTWAGGKSSKSSSKAASSSQREPDVSAGVESITIDDLGLPQVEPCGKDDGELNGMPDDEKAPGAMNLVIDNAITSDVGTHEDDGMQTEEFDWDKQRMIWEEQERQIKERGYADSALDIEMKTKMILNISIEVAGRRLCGYLDQDADLPVEKKEEIFTNCLDIQRGMNIQVFEHERRTKSVAINMLKRDKSQKFPKLLGELTVRFTEPAVRGKLRVAVAFWADENGDVQGYAEERFADGSAGDRSDLLVPRSELCTVEERTQLEVAERKRLEREIEKEMREKASKNLPAITAQGEPTGPSAHDAVMNGASSQHPEGRGVSDHLDLHSST